MRRSLILFLVLAGTTGQAKSITWHDGVLVLKNDKVLVGEVIIEPALNVVLFRSGDQSSYYPSPEINYVIYHDKDADLNRKFMSVATEQAGREINELYEVVLRGEISVIRKPRSANIPALADVGNFDYFVLEDSNQVVKLSQFNKKVFPTIEASFSKQQLREFMHEKKLDPRRITDAIQLIQYYNDWAMVSASAERDM